LGSPIVIGKIVGTFGLKGYVKVWPSTDFPERFEPGRAVTVGGVEYAIRDAQWHKKQVRIRLKGVNHERAEAMIGSDVFADDLDVVLEEGEYRVADLIGLEVFDTEGKLLGTLDEVIAAPAHDIYRVGEALVPAVSEFVKEIDAPGGKVVIAPIPGMFPDES
jgi:16S rRNA processing protein RimM